MEVSALRYSGGIGLHGRSPLLRLQSDERLIALIRRGNSSAFEVLVARYHSRLLAFCRHLLGSKEDAEDVLQEVFAAAFNAMLGDDRPINVRPWLYRIARNRSLNHLRRIQAIGVDSMDVHFSEYGATTADKVHDREQFRLLVGDIHSLPETQRTALVLREMDALSYEQIAEAMDTTVPGVKSLLVRARISLAEAAEARQLSCDEVRLELGEVAEGLRKRPPALVRRHLRACNRCATFQQELKQTNKALAALIPIGPLALLRKLLIIHLGHSAGTGSGATAGAAGATTATGATTGAGAGGLAAGPAAAVASTAGGGAAFGSAGGLLSAGAGALATKAAAGLAAAALVTAGAVEATHATHHASHTPLPLAQVADPAVSGGAALSPPATVAHAHPTFVRETKPKAHKPKASVHPLLASTATGSAAAAQHPSGDTTAAAQSKTHKPDASHTQVQTDPTVLSSPSSTSGSSGSGQATDSSAAGSSSGSTGTTTGSSGSGSTGSTCSSGSATTTSGGTTTTTTTAPLGTPAPNSPPPTTTTTTTDPSPAPSTGGQPPSTAGCPPPAAAATSPAS